MISTLIFKDEIIPRVPITRDDWIIGNLHHAGFYRVNYFQKNWDLLIEQLKTDNTKINSISRATLIDDSFNLGRSKELRQDTFLELSEYLVKEESPLVFATAYNAFDYMYEMLVTNVDAFNTFKVIFSTFFEIRKKNYIFVNSFKKFSTNLFKNAYDKYEWNTPLSTDINEL